MNKGWHGEEVKTGIECKFFSGWWMRIQQILLINRGCNELECLNGGSNNANARSN